MNDGLHDYADKLRALTESLLDHNARLIEQTRRSLSGNDKRYLGYFWNGKAQTVRSALPLSVISFFESEFKRLPLNAAIETRVRSDLGRLVAKGYLRDDDRSGIAFFSLTELGAAYLNNKHPRLIALWEALWERTPKAVSLLIAALGLAASAFGVIQLFHGN